jgi:predicted negative regulator of RcsB-dependent stress response
MAGIGLFNFDIDAKSITPIVILAGIGVAGFFGWKYYQQQQANASAASSPLNALTTEANNAYTNELQMAELQTMFGGGSNTTTGSSSTLGTVQPVSSNSGQNNAGASSAGGNASSEVGNAPAGSV